LEIGGLSRHELIMLLDSIWKPSKREQVPTDDELDALVTMAMMDNSEWSGSPQRMRLIGEALASDDATVEVMPRP
jgi:hypothetical protein